jgi:hypothetical protein
MHKVRNFHEGHSENGRFAAGEGHGMRELTVNTPGERHGVCESAFILNLLSCKP